MRAVIRSTPYTNPRVAGHADWQSRVRAYFEQRAGAEQGAIEDEDCIGVARVRAHTRRGEKGPIHVAAHDRAVPCG
ncbi:MAG: hypothetical protein K2X11_04695 [Acetobacteraceae bacterium]|nr:hypothetical protein [Acetobacteraceae bacterium]